MDKRKKYQLAPVVKVFFFKMIFCSSILTLVISSLLLVTTVSKWPSLVHVIKRLGWLTIIHLFLRSKYIELIDNKFNRQPHTKYTFKVIDLWQHFITEFCVDERLKGDALTWIQAKSRNLLFGRLWARFQWKYDEFSKELFVFGFSNFREKNSNS